MVNWSCQRRRQSSEAMTNAFYNHEHDDAVRKLEAAGYTHEFNLTTGGGVVQTILQNPLTRKLVEVVSEDVDHYDSRVREVRCISLREANQYGGEEAPQIAGR